VPLDATGFEALPRVIVPESPEGKLRRLITALREPMPDRFEWDFGIVHARRHCGTAGCAMGLAKKLGIVSRNGGLHWQLGMKFSEACALFGRDAYGVDPEAVTPAMVADKLQAYCDAKYGPAA
jgi:hypothetical protein